MAPRSEDPKVIRVINFELVQHIRPGYINVIDRRTDERTTYDSNTALALRASRGKNVDDECRHDMRPSIQLSCVSGVDSKLGLTMVRCSLQSVPELPALDPPPLSKHDARLLWRFLTSSDLDL